MSVMLVTSSYRDKPAKNVYMFVNDIPFVVVICTVVEM